MSKSHARTSKDAVLVLDPDGAEWYVRDADGKRFQARIAADGPTAVALASAAARAMIESGSGSRSCVVALGADFLPQRFVTLPALTRADRAQILARKAAGLVSCEPKDALYWAAPLAETAGSDAVVTAGAKSEENGAREQRWFLAAARKSRLTELLVELRRHKVRVRRVVSGAMAVPCRVQALRGEIERACIVVGLDRRCVTVSLIAGSSIHNQNVLDGSFHETPTMALTLLQEIRSYDSFWRKQSRGGSVAQVVVAGVSGARGALLKSAVQNALPQARVSLLSDLDTRADAESPGASLDEAIAGRHEILETALARGDFQLDFTLPIPIQRSAAVAVVVAMALFVAAAGAVGYEGFHTQQLKIVEQVRALNARSHDLEQLSARNAQATARMDVLERLASRNADVLAAGWPLAAILTATSTAFGTDAGLTSFTLGRHDVGAPIEIQGCTSPDPLDAARRIGRIVARLGESAHVHAIEAVPDSKPGDGVVPLAFTINASGEVHP